MKPNAEAIFNFGISQLRPGLLKRDREAVFDRALWQGLAALDLFRAMVPSGLGGSGSSLEHQTTLMKELGRGSLDIPLGVSAVAQIVAIDLLVCFGSANQHQKYLGGLISGDKIAAVCNSEAGAGTDIKAITSALTPVSATRASLKVEKRGATNLTAADVVFCSLWRKGEGVKPALEVAVLDAPADSQKSFIANLAGFKTGLTGSLLIEDLEVDTDQVLLGAPFSGFNILKHCFNLERLLIAAFISGVLETLLEEAVLFMAKRASAGKKLAEHQYMQEKVIAIFNVKSKIDALIGSIFATAPALGSGELARHTKVLSALKLTLLDETFSALTSYFEVFGFPAYTLDHYGQKIIRDHMALRFLGGSKEQQKILLFNELFNEITAKEQLKSDVNNLLKTLTPIGAKDDEGKSIKIS